MFWNFLLTTLVLLITTFILIVVFFKKKYTYWKNLGVEYIEPTFPFGNMKENVLGRISPGEVLEDLYRQLKSRKVIHGGCYSFHMPLYFPIDLDLIKHIMQVDFSHFVDRGAYFNEREDPLSAHLAALPGDKWRNLRVKITPTFTSGKMKMMFPIIVKTSHELVKVLEEECQKGAVETKDLSARYTTDAIGNCAFGIECNSLKDPNTEFRIKGARLFALTHMELLSNFFSFIFPELSRTCGVRLFPKVATEFFLKIIKENVEYREKSGFRRNDAFQLLLDMKNNEGGDSDTSLTFNELAAQAFVFFVGGFETSSTLMSFALLELALNEDVQNNLREEIEEELKRNNGEISYDSLVELRYLDMVLNETLRKYPPLPATGRQCSQDYRVPNTDVVLPKGIMVFIPIQGIHYDPEYYPNPKKFDPTRFSEENKKKRPHYAFIPFGEGPRFCLGQRFALMQAKVGVIAMVRNFKMKVNPKTEIPVKMDPVKFFTGTLGGLWIDLEKIG